MTPVRKGKKKFSRPYVRALLEQLRDLGVRCVIWHSGEIWLDDAVNQRRGQAFEEAVRILATQDRYA